MRTGVRLPSPPLFKDAIKWPQITENQGLALPTGFSSFAEEPQFDLLKSAYSAYVAGCKAANTERRKDQFPLPLPQERPDRRIKKWAEDKFGTYFMFAGQKKRNSFGTFEAALTYLEREFSRIDSNQADSLALNPLNSDVRTYSELEHLLRTEGGGATLREAVAFFLANHKGKRFHPASFDDVSAAFLKAQQARNVSGVQIKTLAKHFRRFALEFGPRKMHEITALEIETWLAAASMRAMVHHGA